jgi:hypothetical protein
MDLEGQLSYQLFQSHVLPLELIHLGLGGIPGSVMLKALFASLHKFFEPGTIGGGPDAFPAAEVPDGGVAPETLQHDADLLFSGEPVAGNPSDVPDESLSLFRPGLSQTGPICNSLYQGSLLSDLL